MSFALATLLKFFLLHKNTNNSVDIFTDTITLNLLQKSILITGFFRNKTIILYTSIVKESFSVSTTHFVILWSTDHHGTIFFGFLIQNKGYW